MNRTPSSPSPAPPTEANSPTVPAQSSAEPPSSVTPPSENDAEFSLPNGTELRKRRNLNGLGELTVENGTSFDAVVHLVDLKTEKTIRTFYVEQGNTFTERQIAPGLYGVYFATGVNWNPQLKRFTSAASFSQFDKNLEYSEKPYPDSGKVEYDVHQITLQPVADGDVTISPLGEDAFDKMMNDETPD